MNQKLLESVLNIDMLCNELSNTIRGLHVYKIKHTDEIGKSIIKYNYILICSFLEEIDIINSFSKENNLIKDIMYCVSPILKEIKLYDGIKVGRNKLFAHYNRDKNFNFIPWWKSLYGVTLPRTIEELVFINAVIGTIRAIIISQYINELEEFKKITKIDVDVYLKFVESEEINAKDKVSKLENIMNEVSKRITEKKIIIRKIM